MFRRMLVQVQVLLDQSTEFDTVDHKILMNRLETLELS